jgi:hypothetical protein
MKTTSLLFRSPARLPRLESLLRAAEMGAPKTSTSQTKSTVRVPIPRSDFAGFFRLAHPPRQPEEHA